jgi:hypothetical protein
MRTVCRSGERSRWGKGRIRSEQPGGWDEHPALRLRLCDERQPFPAKGLKQKRFVVHACVATTSHRRRDLDTRAVPGPAPSPCFHRYRGEGGES